MKPINLVRWIVIAGAITLMSCQAKTVQQTTTKLRINTSHLDHLFEKLTLPNHDTMAIIHIYSEYPDYAWVGDSDEGISCVDDVARAAIFYLRNYRYSGSIENLEKGQLLVRFLLHMQSADGYFFNFIFADYSINRDGMTSRAEANWWSWRALWALGEAIEIISPESSLHDQMIESRNHLVDVIVRDYNWALNDSFATVDGFKIPQWLPGQSAADQASLMLLGLHTVQNYRKSTIDSIISSLQNGIRLMQVMNKEVFPHGAFLSWQNHWHAYGNSQSYALLKSEDSRSKAAALIEIDFFYRERMQNEISQFKINQQGDTIKCSEVLLFPQIAYNIRPVIWACLEASKITGEEKYHLMAKEVSRWFDDENPANTIMFDPNTGRCFDGIQSEKQINRNSGAESTIEALLALQELYYFQI